VSQAYDERGFPAIPDDMAADRRDVLLRNRELLEPGDGASDDFRRTVPPRDVDSESDSQTFVTARNSFTDLQAPPPEVPQQAVRPAVPLNAPTKKGIFSKIGGFFSSLWKRMTGGNSASSTRPKKYPWMKDRVWNAPPYRAGVGRAGASGAKQWRDDPNLDMPRSHVEAWDQNTGAAHQAMQTRRAGDMQTFATQRAELERTLRAKLSDKPGSKRGDADRVSGLLRTMLNESAPDRTRRQPAEADNSRPIPGGAGYEIDGIPTAPRSGFDHPDYIPPAIRAVFPDFDETEGRFGRYSGPAESIDSDKTLSNWAEDQQFLDEDH